jgi:acid phosphatase
MFLIGERNPTFKIPAYSSAPSDGYLTEKGFENMYKLGEFLRKHYLVDPYPKNYMDGAFYFYSTSIDRAKRSISGTISGLFPDGTGPKVEGQCAIPGCKQPVPVISEAYEREWMLLGEETW